MLAAGGSLHLIQQEVARDNLGKDKLW